MSPSANPTEYLIAVADLFPACRPDDLLVLVRGPYQSDKPFWHAELPGQLTTLLSYVDHEPTVAEIRAALAKADASRADHSFTVAPQMSTPYHAASDSASILFEAARTSTTLPDLLRNQVGREACYACARAGKSYSADAEQYATRSVVRQAVALLAARLERRLAKHSRDAFPAQSGRMVNVLAGIKARRAEAVRKQIAARIAAAADGLYRVSQTRWAGGDHSTTVKIGAPAASGDSTTAWSSNGKWSGKDSEHRFTVPADWIAAVDDRNLEVCDGMLTLDARPVPGGGAELFAASWVEQGRGFDLNVVCGYLARSDDGTTYHAPTAKAALIGLARKLGQKPPRRKGSLNLDRYSRLYGGLAVTLADSQAAGNCDSGTRNWCAAVGINAAGTTTLAALILGYRLRPLPEVLTVIRRVVRSRDGRKTLPVDPREIALRADAAADSTVRPILADYLENRA